MHSATQSLLILEKSIHTGMITRLLVVNNYYFKIVYHAMLYESEEQHMTLFY